MRDIHKIHPDTTYVKPQDTPISQTEIDRVLSRILADIESVKARFPVTHECVVVQTGKSSAMIVERIGVSNG